MIGAESEPVKFVNTKAAQYSPRQQRSARRAIRSLVLRYDTRLPPARGGAMHQLEVEFTFAAAHRLPRHPGKCKHMHGHNYRLQVVLRGEPDAQQGLVLDFDDVSAAVQKQVLALCDHKTFNDFLENPTAENIASWAWTQLDGKLAGLFEVRLWEIPTACVVYRGPRGFAA
jgi:6-pyruvoyltetrahydropterin/6-carboxytetrahydropterin synthase